MNASDPRSPQQPSSQPPAASSAARASAELPAASPRQRFAWCLYDFANSPYPTVIITFVYGAWFRGALAADEASGDATWAWAMALSGILVAILSPVAGYLADHRRATYRYLVLSTLFVIVGAASLALAGRDPATGHGSTATVVWVLTVVVLTNAVFELAFVFYNAFLPRLVGPEGSGRLSGQGWAFGYVGGLLCLGVCLMLLPGDGASAAALDSGVATGCLVVAGWFALFGIPSLLGLRTVPAPVAPSSLPTAADGPTTAATPGIAAGVRGVLHTVRGLPRYPDLMRLLIARLIYNDAVMALISLAALYMAGTLEMSLRQITIVGIGLNVAAGLGAWVFGFLDERRGGRWTVMVSLVLLIAGAVLALAVPTVGAFYVAAALIGIALGPNQAASRSLLARFVPPSRSTEFYGLFALSGKATVWIGPALFGIIMAVSGDQRLALLPVVVMLVVGWILVSKVDEARGVALARTLEAGGVAEATPL